MIVAVRQVQGHCEYVDRNAKLDDGRAKCGEIHQQFRLKDMMDDKHIGDLRALETSRRERQESGRELGEHGRTREVCAVHFASFAAKPRRNKHLQ